MIEFTTDKEKNKIANEQLEYFVSKYKNLPQKYHIYLDKIIMKNL